MAVAKRQRKGKSRKNRTQEDSRTGVRTSGKTNNTLGWRSLHRTGPGRDKHIKRGAKASFLSLSLSLSLFHVLGHSFLRLFGSTCPHVSEMDFFVIF